MNKNLFLVGLVGLVVLLGAVLQIDNVDRTPWGESTFRGHTLIVGGRMLMDDPKTQEALKAQYDEAKFDSLKDILKASKNQCLGGADASKMTLKEITDAFVAGPCNPVILVPGLAGTSFQATIDCETLQRERPEIFAGCGWSTCSPYQVWKKRPDTEYRLWISSVSSPVGIIMTSKKNTCFGDVIQILYDPTKEQVKERYSDVPGIKVAIYGQTPKTQSNSECGLGAITELTDDTLIKMATCEHKGFLNLAELFKGMGYVSGVTLQALPYDYRRDIVATDVPAQITTSIQNMKKITGKKAIIITHSLGSLYGVHTLQTLTQEFKDENVATLMTIGGPYLGSTKSVRSNMGGDPGYMDKWLGHDVGINYYCQNKAINSGSSGLDLYPKDTFFRFAQEPWMADIHKRIQMEEEYLKTRIIPNEEFPLDWFPSPSENCTKGFGSRPDSCLTGLSDMTKPFIQIGNEAYDAKKESISEMLVKHSVNGTKLNEFFKEAQLPTLDQYNHPGVPTIVVYGNFLQVEETFQYDESPRGKVEQIMDFYFPKVTKQSTGDGTVMSTSAITTAIKWIHENKNNQIQYPTKLVEFCSSYNSGNIHGLFDQGGKAFTSGYHGIECECIGKKDASSCKHSCMINDKFIIQLAMEVVTQNETSVYSQSPLSGEELEAFLSSCQNIRN